LGKSSSPAPTVEALASGLSNVIAFPAPPRGARPHCCFGEEEQLGAPELVPHALGICELAFSIASAVVGHECCSQRDEASEERHERVYGETLALLCKLTSQLVEEIRQRHGVREVRPRVE